MADDAKNPTADKSVDEKGQAKETTNQPDTKEISTGTENSESKEVHSDEADAKVSQEDDTVKTDEIPEAEVVKNTAKESSGDNYDESANDSSDEVNDDSDGENEDTEDTSSAKSTKKSTRKSKQTSKSASTHTDSATVNDADFQATVREQIENCKFEIVASLQESIHNEVSHVMHGQIRKAERRRVFGIVIRDILILILIVVAGFFAYRLYEYGEFRFLFPACESNNSCDNQITTPTPEPEPEVIKDLAWYRQNYGYLFDNLQMQLNADKVSAYYLYSGDYKVGEIAPEYLLSMAYNQLNSNYYYGENGLVIPATDLRAAFVDTFGNADNFIKKNFTHNCNDFTYDQNNDAFIAPNLACNSNSTRQILEEITEIYEEGNVMYFLTTAAIYDQNENSYYTFDNLFHPAIANVTEDDLSTHASLLNKYQYQFKRTDDNRFYFSGIIKLK